MAGIITRTEQHLNTAVEVREWIVVAASIVDDLALPDDLRVAAFGKAVDLLAAKQIWFEQAGAVALPPVLR